MLTPEERNVIEASAAAEHVEGDDLSLALRDHPVLDAETEIGVRVRPPRHVADGKNSTGAFLKKLIDVETVTDLLTPRFSELEIWSQSHAANSSSSTEPT